MRYHLLGHLQYQRKLIDPVFFWVKPEAISQVNVPIREIKPTFPNLKM